LDIYAENILEHYKNPQNKGVIKDADIIQTGANPLCGDHLALYINHDKTKITDVKFEGKGCAISQASASILTDELKGMTLKDAAQISKDDVLEMLGVELGPARLKCGLLIWDTLREALKKST
jgi:nitrogen fixation NifU-like protein